MLWYLKHNQPNVLYIDKKGGEYNFGQEAKTYAQIKAATRERPFKVRISKPDIDAVNWSCEYACELSAKGPLIYAVDEMQAYSFPKAKGNPDGFELLLDEGGMRAVSFIGTTHRPGDINGNMLAAADKIIVFQTHHSRDVEKLQDYIDVPREAFMELKQSEYIEWNNGKGYKIVRREDRK